MYLLGWRVPPVAELSLFSLSLCSFGKLSWWKCQWKKKKEEEEGERNEAGDDEARALNVAARIYVCIYVRVCILREIFGLKKRGSQQVAMRR